MIPAGGAAAAPFGGSGGLCICKTSIVIRTSGSLAAILDFEHTSTSHEARSNTTRKLEPENIGVAVGVVSMCALELDICLGPFSFPLVLSSVRLHGVGQF